ncbi:MAG: nucleoside recognition domain-containing protein, partial [Verrucomicrobiales bacterium]
MALNIIWVGFLLIGIFTALCKLIFWGDFAPFQQMLLMLLGGENSDGESVTSMAKLAATISLGYIGLMALWLGIMKIGERGGAVAVLTRLVAPFFCRLFPGLPRDHPACGSIMMNFSANMLGLDNAATPLGLKAMDQLQELNPDKDTASDAQIMFLVLNTSGLTIIPISVMTLRAVNGAANPADIFVPILIATYVATLVGLVTVAMIQKINLLRPVVLAYLGGATAAVVGMIAYFNWVGKVHGSEAVQHQSTVLAALFIFGVIGWFLILALIARIDVYGSFVDGAKEGFGVAIKIIPYLVAMLVAVGIFRASGAMGEVIGAIAWCVGSLGVDTAWVEGLPTALMKPLSGSGARGMAVEAMTTHGVDSFVGRLACTLQGSTETTFYTLAVYFGAVGVTRTRYTVLAGLAADVAGIIA